MNQSEYIAEKMRRQDRGLTHWEAMMFKHDDAGFSKWGWNNQPLPHYYLYKGYFLFLISNTPAHELLPRLEYDFYGDGLDLDYLEGLLLGYEEAGVTATPNPIAVDDVSGMIILLDDMPADAMHVDDQEEAITEERARNAQVVVSEKGQSLAGRFEIIRKWIDRKRVSPRYVELHITLDEADPSLAAWVGASPKTNQVRPSNMPTISDLCLAPFTLSNFDELLVRLHVIDTKRNCLTNTLAGPASGKKGAFIAAYRILHRDGLMETATNSQIGEALKQEYGAELGVDALAHELTPNGSAPTITTKEFRRAVEACKEWLYEWKRRLEPGH